MSKLHNRGPDHQQTIHLGNSVTLSAFVLHVQREFRQPCSLNGEHLLFNGQLFNYPSRFSNDTEFLFDSIISGGVLQTVSEIRGPCAAIFYNEAFNEIWFWRDYFGRRSLLVSTMDGGGLIISSVGDSQRPWVEVPAAGVFCLMGDKLYCYPYSTEKDMNVCQEFGANLQVETVVVCKEFALTTPVSSLFKNCTSVYQEYDIESDCGPFLELLSKAVEVRSRCCSSPLDFNDDLLEDFSSRHCYCSVVPECPIHLTMRNCWASHARIGVLFSGGVDCTVLAALVNRYVPPDEPIDLLNVAFGSFEKTPDRIAAIASFRDLQNIAPEREWNLIEVNVSVEELRLARERYVTDLLYPHKTVLDDSIGCALWFAARGFGLRDGEAIFSTARLLFSGIGADELLGGYSRHRGAWQNGKGLEGVLAEMELDINRIAERNMGRDNRVIGDHRRDCVAPFLDEAFVSFVNELPVQCKVDFTLPRGEGEKLILRRVAEQLGLVTSSVLPKKAIQFGSRIAKLEGKKEKGCDVCSRLNTGNEKMPGRIKKDKRNINGKKKVVPVECN